MPSHTPDTFPIDDYTPHGYLDVPEHTKRLNLKGVVRSHDIGFRWHYPAFSGMYGGKRETYRAGVRVAIDGVGSLVEFADASSPYHSKNLVRLQLPIADGAVNVEYYVIGADVLTGRIQTPPGHRVAIRADYTRLIGADFSWGESGLLARREGDIAILQAFEDGEAFALWVSTSDTTVAVTGESDQADAWFRDGLPADWAPSTTVLGERGQEVTVTAVAELDQIGADVEFMLARGRTADDALRNLSDARSRATATRTQLLEQDQSFWRGAPVLTGDWPSHWRRGLVYDLETVRMMVKPPVGIYDRVWDAMQIQAPRVVLGEAAIDALLLSYADPGAAQELMLGTFADAPLPQVPCSREDGSYNMVSAHGEVCGTGPQWGYPWLVLTRLWEQNPDQGWLSEILPHLEAYLSWWMERRTSGDGWLGHACSWESGQDLSPRFGDQPLGGGHPTQHLRPVDLHAAFSHAAATTARFATDLGDQLTAQRWAAIADDYRARTSELWDGSGYRDFDANAGSFTKIDDIMLLAPLTLGISEPDRGTALSNQIAAIDAADLVWPMFAWTAVDAAISTRQLDVASRVAADIIDRAYRFWDRRTADGEHTLPGIACEYWPASGRCGGEGYGWGAFTTYLLLDTLLGVRVVDGQLHLRPNLPAELRISGAEYGLTLSVSGQRTPISLRPRGEHVQLAVGDDVVLLPWGQEHTWAIT